MSKSTRNYTPGETPLADVIITHELENRKSRESNFQMEAEALRELAASMSGNPDQILQTLSEVVLRLCNSHSAGVSLIDHENNHFRWRAVAGKLSKFLNATLPLHFSPCAEVIKFEKPMLMKYPERHFTYIADLGNPVSEVLLIPFFQNGKPAGTIWTVFHTDHRHFDNEDLRILTSVSHFASAAIQSKIANQRIETVDSQLREFFLQIPTPMVILEGPDFLYTLANPPYEKMVGQSVLKKTVLECFPEAEVGEFVKQLKTVYQTGVPYIGDVAPLPIFDQDGKVVQRHIRVEYYPYRNPSGQIIGIFAMHHDLTDIIESRKATEIAKNSVMNERANFRNLFRQTPEMVCITTGPDHVFEFVNEAHIRVLGFDATGMAVRVAQPESVEVHGLLDSVYRTGITEELHEIPVTVGDRLRYFNLTYAARFDDDGKPSGVMILGTEITEQFQQRLELKAAKEEAEHANSLKSAFLANMSHEIRTPLGAMIGFADLMRDPSLSQSERLNYIDIMTRNGESLSVIINDILDLSKVEAGHLALDFKKAKPSTVANEVISLMQVKALEKNLKLTFVEDISTPTDFVIDTSRVKQILLNLISNAIKFTPFGSVTLRSFGTPLDSGKTVLSFEVKDTGIGIPSSQRENIFEMFVQADGSITRKFGGTGLGLALSRRLARAMGGDVVIGESAPGKGSTFLVTIIGGQNISDAAPVPEHHADYAKHKKENSVAGKKILVVDDSTDNQDLIGQYLKRGGAHVDYADNGLVGYNKALAHDYDVILMDVQMPEMDGYTATQKLRDAGYKTPIIALTAHVMTDVRQKCLNVGCSSYLPKPINPKELYSAIARYTQE